MIFPSHANDEKILAAVESFTRILIIGACGAGKSTLAEKIAHHIALPVLHLDNMYYLPDWNHINQAEFATAQTKFMVENHQWIIDGNYQSTLELRLREAEAIIVLNPSPIFCAFRVIMRRITHYGKAQPYNNPACIEKFNRATFPLIRYILRYRKDSLPKVKELLSTYSHVQCINIP